MKREECLDKAKENVTGHRVQDYGKPERSFQVIADYWNVYLTRIDHTVLTARDVATMLAIFKIARITTGAAVEDSYVDAAGYIACAVELLEEEVSPKNVFDQTDPKNGKFVPDGNGGLVWKDAKGETIKGGITYTDEGGL